MLQHKFHHVASLSKLVLLNSKIIISLPSDFKTLNQLIEAKTGQHISEIALQRLYGFQPSRFPPSLYTLKVLSSYCGFENWDEFCKAQDRIIGN